MLNDADASGFKKVYLAMGFTAVSYTHLAVKGPESFLAGV